MLEVVYRVVGRRLHQLEQDLAERIGKPAGPRLTWTDAQVEASVLTAVAVHRYRMLKFEGIKPLFNHDAYDRWASRKGLPSGNALGRRIPGADTLRAWLNERAGGDVLSAYNAAKVAVGAI